MKRKGRRFVAVVDNDEVAKTMTTVVLVTGRKIPNQDTRGESR
ncbi:MAG: hypothetical protein R3C68_11275 [Myxococcota bacterium]